MFEDWLRFLSIISIIYLLIVMGLSGSIFDLVLLLIILADRFDQNAIVSTLKETRDFITDGLSAKQQ